ncbi:hypothetical protein KBD81_00680 [Candidatus Woesebacteria bacterium]|nr:hypothetical protein [Candidatus Woesebacteria bacterium]
MTGEFIAGLIAIDGVGASINSLGEPLRLQSDKMADVEFMGGLVKVTTEGNIDVDG